MKNLLFSLLLLALLGLASCGDDQGQQQSQAEPSGPLADGLYAKIITNQGELIARLTYQQTPLTVANFVGLAEGSLPNNVKPQGEPYYDGIVFHRVMKNFMAQVGDPNTLPGGDPRQIGRGNPGYFFRDEIRPDLLHNTAGTLSMANMGPGTNGSQFFITHKATDWLNGKHSVFGYVVRGLPTLYQIQQGDTLRHIEIIRQGDAAQAFDPQPYVDELMQGKVGEWENEG